MLKRLISVVLVFLLALMAVQVAFAQDDEEFTVKDLIDCDEYRDEGRRGLRGEHRRICRERL